MAKTKILRISLALYFPLAVALYFLVLHGQYGRVSELERSLAKITTSERHRQAVQEVGQMKERHRQQLGDIIKEFRSKVEGFDKISLPIFVGQVAKDAQVEIVKLEVKHQAKVQDCTFVRVEIEVRGLFERLHAFLSDLEAHEKRFVFVDQVKIWPIQAAGPYGLIAGVNVMLRPVEDGEVVSEEESAAGEDTSAVRGQWQGDRQDSVAVSL